MRLAPLTDAHLEAATDLWTTGWHDAHAAVVPEGLLAVRTRENFRARLEAFGDRTTLACKDGVLSGFFVLTEGELDQFYVARAARGTGFAADLMRAAETALAQAGHKTAWLACTVGNTRAARFYEKTGWRHMATETYEAFTHNGPFPLLIWRYEKMLNADP